MLFNLHLLRAIAALAVVYFHITSEAGLNLPVNIGAHGVDVFFVISGFIISYISARAPEHFFVRRLIRIVPFYWTATLFVFSIAVAFPHLLRSTRPDFVQLICSLFFIPRETSYAGMFPTLILGWSLNYEMYFYVVFAACLLVTRRWSPLLCAALIGVIVIAIDLSGATSPTVRFYARPIVYEFCYGIACYYVFALAERRAASLREWVPGRLILWAILAGALGALAFEEYHAGLGLPRFVSAGVPALLLVASALMLERVYGVSANSRSVYLLGESSYILYLIHPYIIYTILRVAVPGARGYSASGTGLLIVSLLVVSATAAVAIHQWFEKPLMAYLRAKLIRPDARHGYGGSERG